jgi:hypothetical protein
VNIQTEDYLVQHDAESNTITLTGFLRLNGMNEYRPIMDMMLEVVEQSPVCIIDLRDLEFLNSSGISMLSMFVVKVRDAQSTQLSFIGSNTVLWQTRSLKNLKRLMPSLEIQFVD